MNTPILGFLALGIGAAALTLGILAERERVQIQEAYEQQLEARKPPPKFSFRIRSVSFAVGENPEPQEPIPPPPKYPPFWVATLATGVMGLVFAPLAWVREKQPILCGVAISLCAAGLLWHYLVLGVAVAVAIIVLAALLGTMQ